jgi:Ca2+:H+ antiporter
MDCSLTDLVDSIKSRARHASWRTEEKKSFKKYNPFRRHRPHVDEEAQNAKPSEDSAPDYHNTDSLNSFPETRTEEHSGGPSRKPPGLGVERTPSSIADEKLERSKRAHHNRLRARIPILAQFRAVLAPRMITINWLLLLSPVGFALNYTHVGAIPTFIINFIVIFPYAMVVLYAGVELNMRSGEVFGSLVFVSIRSVHPILSSVQHIHGCTDLISNVPQLVISIILLKSRSLSQITILKASLIGAIVSNLHLLLGLGFLFGGINRANQFFNQSTASTCGMLLFLATMGLMVPTIASLDDKTSPDMIVKLSRGTAVTLISSYGLFTFFRLKSHIEWFKEKGQKVEKQKTKSAKSQSDAFKALAHAGGRNIAEPDDEEDLEVPTLSLSGAYLTLIISTVLLAFHTDFATNNFTVITGQLSSSFIGMVLLPLFAIDPGCVIMSQKDQQDDNVDNTLGKCIQTAFVVIPFLVLLAWIMKIPEMTLLFTNFEVGTLFLSVIIVNYITSDGKSNW